jgi:hypothetical protein
MDEYLPYEVTIEVDGGLVKIRVTAKERLDREVLRATLGEALRAVWDLREDIERVASTLRMWVPPAPEARAPEVRVEVGARPEAQVEEAREAIIYVTPEGGVKFPARALEVLSSAEAIALLLYEQGGHTPKELADKVSHGFKKISPSSVRAVLTGSKSRLAKYVVKDGDSYVLTEEGRRWVEEQILPKLQG